MNRIISDFFKNNWQFFSQDISDNSLIGKLYKKIISLTLAFLLISPFMATYQFTQGDSSGQYSDFSEVADKESIEEEAVLKDNFLMPRIDSDEIFVYTVEPGDTLSSIAQRFSIKKETLMAENNLWNPNLLRVGIRIKVLPVDGLSHVVKKSETVEKIAKKYKIETETLITQNQLTEDERLETNKVLIIPGAKREAPTYFASTAPANVSNHSVSKVAVGRLIWPTVGTITQGCHRRHLAIDIANRNKGPIFAAASGKVIKARAGWNGGYGNVIIIDHENGMQTLYAHNEKFYVTEGQYVEQGQTISWMGNTGRVYGPTGIHLHFEVRIKGVKYNPMNFF